MELTRPATLDEMVDGRGGLRPHWRTVLSAFTTLGEGGLPERARRLDRAFEEEGVTSLLPGSDVADHAWRCDPVPLPLPAAEFAELEAGLAQRAKLLEAVLQDIYGPQTLLSDGVLPPALVYANPAFLRPCHVPGGGPRQKLMQFYAADLVRGPDGAWRVLADRTAGAAGVGYARENRRLLARVMPEAFSPVQVRQLRPFFDIWQDALQRMAPDLTKFGRRSPAVALLTPGTGHAQWFEHMFLARELSCALVEGGDLTVRGGSVFLKTLKGLQPVDVLLRRLDGRMVDPLEFEPGSVLGVPGLMDAMRSGAVRVTNDPGSGAVEAPALAAFLPALAMRLLDERLTLASVPTMWLGEARARDIVQQDLARWLIRPSTDGRARAIAPATLDDEARRDLAQRIDARPWDFAASAAIPPSVAPCVSETGMEPRPVVLRLFLVFDGMEWRAMQGGLARVMEDHTDPIAGGLPRQGLSKDVWVLSEDRTDIIGPTGVPLAPLKIRRTAGELPSRAADDLFWLGRYVERLEGAARLVRATLIRLNRGTLLPREMSELEALSHCLAHIDLIPKEAAAVTASSTMLADALMVSVRDGGAINGLYARVARLTEMVRDRLTGDMYAAFTHTLRAARDDAAEAAARRHGRNLDELSHAMVGTLRFSATVAGVAAENMVRGGGWLFLDLGRRIERAQTVASSLAYALDHPPARIEAGLRLVLELCDSAITYRSRYLTVLQPAPVLDLVLADEGNPRGLAFQLAGISSLLADVAGPGDAKLAEAASALLAETNVLVQRVIDARDQSVEAAALPPALRDIEAGVAALSDHLMRRYFALLPVVQTLGTGSEVPSLRGAA